MGGITSSPITIAKYILKEEKGTNSDSENDERNFSVAFLSRHGLNHEYIHQVEFHLEPILQY